MYLAYRVSKENSDKNFCRPGLPHGIPKFYAFPQIGLRMKWALGDDSAGFRLRAFQRILIQITRKYSASFGNSVRVKDSRLTVTLKGDEIFSQLFVVAGDLVGQLLYCTAGHG